MSRWARRSVVRADERLRERELTAFSVAIERWLDQESERSLAEHLREILTALRAVTA